MCDEGSKCRAVRLESILIGLTVSVSHLGSLCVLVSSGSCYLPSLSEGGSAPHQQTKLQSVFISFMRRVSRELMQRSVTSSENTQRSRPAERPGAAVKRLPGKPGWRVPLRVNTPPHYTVITVRLITTALTGFLSRY